MAVRTTVALDPVHQPLVFVHWLSAVVCGARPSMFSPPTVLPALLLPATSVAGSLVTLWSAPLPLTSLSLGQLATPDRLSVHENPTITSPLYQPELLGSVVGAPVIVGAVRS